MLYHHVQRLSLSFYDRRQTGDMVVRLTRPPLEQDDEQEQRAGHGDADIGYRRDPPLDHRAAATPSR
jgi:hypothetical protein